MKAGKWILAAAVVLGGTSYLVADDMTKAPDPTSQPATLHARKARLVEPWSQMKDLTPEQSEKIAKIHADALEQKKKIDEKADDDVMALLTPAQVDEVKTIEDKQKETRKERAAERTKKGKMVPTTAPVK